MALTIYNDTTVAYLDVVKQATYTIVRNVELKTAKDGTDITLNKERSSELLTIKGTVYNNAYDNLSYLNDLAEEQLTGDFTGYSKNQVRIINMSDTELNGWYLIESILFEYKAGMPDDECDFTIVFHRARD